MRALICLIALLSWPAAGARAADVAASTAAAPARPVVKPEPVFGGPIRFQFRYDDRSGATAEIGYRLRWDVSDIKYLPGRTARLAMNPFGTAERAAREMFGDADVGAYSMRFRLGKYLPLDTLLRPLAIASDAVEAGYTAVRGSSGFDVPASAAPDPDRRRRRRRRLDYSPVVDEIERDLRREIRRGIITGGVDLALPQARGASYGQKKAIVDSLRQAGETWEFDLKLPDTEAKD
jgi:hypothetical protein